MKIFNGNFYSFTGESKRLFCFQWAVFKRYLALFLWCLVILALYFSYDVPGSLQNHIMNQFHLSALQFSYLYSVYSWPNIVMCFIGGFLVDRVFGPKLGLIIYVGITTLGVALFVVGANVGSYKIMLLGRLVIGLGCESAVVTLNNYIVMWFSGKELNMVFAIVLNIGRIGSALAFEGSEPIIKAMSASGVPQEQILARTTIAMGSVIAVAMVSSLLVALLNPEEKQGREEADRSEVAPAVRFSDVLNFPLQFWLLCFICGVHLDALYSFLGLSQASLTSKFHVSNEIANQYVSFFSVFGAVLSPVLGVMIDKKGRNLSYVTFGIVTGIISFALLAFTNANPYTSMFFLAISVASLLSSGFTLVSYIIPEHQLGTAFGLLQAILNVMFSGTSLTAGAVADVYGPEMMEVFMLVLLAATIPLLIWSWVEDFRHTKILNMSSKKRTEVLEKMKKTDSGDDRKISVISNHYNADKNKTELHSDTIVA